MKKWADASQLCIQLPKCGILHLGRSNPKHSYNFGDVQIPSVDCVRDLGVHLDSKLSFGQHIEIICKTANRTANLILRSFASKRPSFMMRLFNTFVRSKLEYASQIWNPHLIRLIDRLERIQRQFTRRLPGLKDVSYSNRLAFLSADSLELRRMHLDLLFLYKLLHGFTDVDFSKYFEFKSSVTRGHTWALVLKHFNKDQKKFSFSQRVVNVWNFLPESVVSSPTVLTFKKSLHSINLTRFLRGAWSRGLN